VNKPGYSVVNAERYGWGPDAPADPRKLAVLRRFVLGPAVLDVGCASGTYVDLLTSDGLEVTGLEAIPEFLREAEARGRKGRFVLGGAESMPFADKSFDSTILFDVLEHLDDQAVVAEAVRVTRRRLLVLVPLTDPPELLDNNFVFQHHRDRTHRREYTVENLTRLFIDRGGVVYAVEPAYPANPRGLLADSLRVPPLFRRAVRGLLRLLKPALKPHYSEVFLIVDLRPA
jgi:SAM-dependent methyltransferase